MVFQLETCSDEDLDRAFAIISDSFGHEHPYFDYCFPHHVVAAGRKVGAERLRAMKKSSPTVTFLKVTDAETGTIVAVAKWNVYDGVLPEEAPLDGDFWESEDEKKLAQEIFAGYVTPRRKAIRESGGRIVSLDLLCVDPAHQRRGVGRMLVKWGTQVADNMGVKTVVESSPQGRRLYESEGFQVEMELYTVKLSERFSNKPTQSFSWLVRPASAL